MLGNAWQWCSDWYAPSYYKSNPPMKNPQGAPSGFMHVVRGGSWGSPPAIARSATRRHYLIPSANIRYYSFGFRVAPNRNARAG